MATATENDTTMTVHIPGKEPVTTKLSDLEKATDALTNRVADVLEEAHPGLLGGERIGRYEQLTFDVGGSRPNAAKLAIGGKITIHDQMRKGDQVTVNVIDSNGEIIAHAPGEVTAIAFIDKKDKEGFVTTTREHKITLDT